MSIVDWAHVILPLTALVIGVWWSMKNGTLIERGVNWFDKLLQDTGHRTER